MARFFAARLWPDAGQSQRPARRTAALRPAVYDRPDHRRDAAVGGDYSVDFTADCFAEADKSYTVEIIADGYETLTLKIENNSLVDGD